MAPNDLNNCGPTLYAAPFAQSIVILKPLKLNCLGKFFFIISMYFSEPLSNLFTLPNIPGFDMGNLFK